MKIDIAPLFYLFCIFLVLKLTKVITWSWLWVSSPLWIPLAFAIGIFLIYCFALFLKEVLS